MIYHNLKVALRNLLKYKLQTFISVLSIAVGIVTLAFTHAALSRVKFPLIYSQPYYDRTYDITLVKSDDGASDSDGSGNGKYIEITSDMVRALKRDGGLRSVEQLAIPNGVMYGDVMEWHLCDSTTRKQELFYTLLDPDYPRLLGFRSALTGKPIKRLEPGEAIISRHNASLVFGDANPIGAVWPQTSTVHPLPLTIVDVFEDLSIFETLLNNRTLYYCLGEIEGDLCGAQSEGKITWTVSIHVVLKKGYTLQQLQEEVDQRLEPFGMKASIQKIGQKLQLTPVILINSLVHLVGALILLAAVLGFLRMQVQLFWMRRRELSLRITHGAKRWQLYGLLFTEVFLVVGLAVAAAMLMGEWLELFCHIRLAKIIDRGQLIIRHLSLYSCSIGGILLLGCALIIWMVLARICKSTQGLAAAMRRSRTHLFRNIMLGVQITIAMIFVCGSFIVTNWSDQMMGTINLTSNQDNYRNTLLLKVQDPQKDYRLLEEIAHLPSLEKMIDHDATYLRVMDIDQLDAAKKRFRGSYLQFFGVKDTALVDYYQLKAHWFKQPSEQTEGLLLNDSLYRTLQSLDLASSNTLTLKWYDTDHTLPILGTIPPVPYQHGLTSIMIYPDSFPTNQFLLVPKDGQYKQLLSEVESVIDRLVPNHLPDMLQNFHDSHGEVLMLESFGSAVWILGAVSIIICAMGIYSTITLDTRSRRKEMAIRKVNGAKSRDIYRLFGRVYLLLILLSLLIVVPVAVIFHKILYTNSAVSGLSEEAGGSPFMACLAGALIVIVMIAVIVLSNVRSLMRTNPSEIIAKE